MIKKKIKKAKLLALSDFGSGWLKLGGSVAVAWLLLCECLCLSCLKARASPPVYYLPPALHPIAWIDCGSTTPPKSLFFCSCLPLGCVALGWGLASARL